MANTYKFTIYCKTFPTLKNSKQFRLNKKTNQMFLSASNDNRVKALLLLIGM